MGSARAVEMALAALEEGGVGSLAEGERAALESFISELVHWSVKVHLVGKSRMDETIAAQVLDSYLLLHFAEEMGALARRAHDGAGWGGSPATRIADIGAGAGFPGVIWKIGRPEHSIWLFERREKPVLFLERTITSLGLDGIHVVRGDAACSRELSPFDCAISKAAGRFPVMLPVAAELVGPGGWYFTIKGRGWHEELEGVESGPMQHEQTSELAGGRGALLAFRKQG